MYLDFLGFGEEHCCKVDIAVATFGQLSEKLGYFFLKNTLSHWLAGWPVKNSFLIKRYVGRLLPFAKTCTKS